MSGWAKRNLAEIDDVSPEGAGMQWRFARAALGSTDLGVSRFTFEPGTRMPWGHRHRTQEEAYVVIGGSGWIKLDDERVELAPWDVVRVSREVARGLEAGPDGLDVLCIGGPGEARGDGIRIDDFWDPAPASCP
jgi:quercetin dioxygenase-like cupin family protein